MVARMTCLLRTKRIPACKLRQVFCSSRFSRAGARDRQHEKKKEKRADGVDDVNAGKANVRDDESANGRANNRADLKNAAVPVDSIGESVPRHQRREK